MHVVFSPDHAKHRPEMYFRAGGFVPHPEKPERAEAIAAELKRAGFAVEPPRDYGGAPRAAVHAPDYLGFLESAHRRWTAMGAASREVVPNIHPGRHMTSLPKGLVGQVGWYTTDMSSPIGPATWEAAVASANVAVHAVERVLEGMAAGDADAAYALCRPPGHHAFADMCGGFCFLNNIAIAAERAVRRGKRPAILDVDVHHGNGTQGIFYGRRDVLTVSLHCDPADFYPFFSGHVQERGEGEGRGANLNLPLARGTGDNAYLDALAEGLATIRAFAPDIVFVALGLDGYEGDPFQGFRLTTGGFGRIARAIGELGLPTVLVQEGGYNCDDLGKNVRAFLEGFALGRVER
jgi:acetoin utilization deacetylase AcuC-like enzyme